NILQESKGTFQENIRISGTPSQSKTAKHRMRANDWLFQTVCVHIFGTLIERDMEKTFQKDFIHSLGFFILDILSSTIVSTKKGGVCPFTNDPRSISANGV